MRISKETHLRFLLRTQDVCLTVLAYVVSIQALAWTGVVPADQATIFMHLLPVPLLLACFASVRSRAGLHNQDLMAQLWFALRHSFVVVGGLLLFLYLAQVDVQPEHTMISFAALLSGGLIANRVFLRWWYLTRRRESPSNYLKVLIVGAGARSKTLIKNYQATSEWGLHVVGILDPDPAYHDTTIDGIPVLGGLEQIEQIVSSRVIDEVLICIPRSLINDMQSIAQVCSDEGVCLKFVADLYEMQAAAVRLEHIGSSPVLSFEPVSQDTGQMVTKRLVDLLGTVAAAPFLTVLFLIIAVAIKLDSRGPVLFRQERVGLHKRRFAMLKFRSMYADAENRLAEIEHLNEAQGPIFKSANDPRVTRVGRVLRKTSLDELPQFLNVFLGQMSLVGPRPMSVRDVERFDQSLQRKRFSVRPGLVCLREVSGRSKLSFDRWLELDLKYIDEWSLWMDLKILAKAVPAVLRGDGAH